MLDYRRAKLEARPVKKSFMMRHDEGCRRRGECMRDLGSIVNRTE